MSNGSGGGRGHLVYRDRKVLLKYHRLLSGTHPHPPNSLAGLRWVLAHGAEVVEFDIGLSRDGHFCLNHDATLERETTGRGPLRAVTVQEFKSLRLRDSDEPTATLTDVVATLSAVPRPIKVQVDLKEAEPITPEIGRALLESIAPLRATAHIRVVVGCLGDWNLRLLRRLDPALPLGLDFMLYLDAPVDELARLPMRVNVYGYLDDHPLGFRRLVNTKAYLQDRLEVLLDLVPGAVEFYVRKEFLLRAMADGLNPVAFIHEHKPGALVDVWTFYADEPDLERTLMAALDAGADQISSPSCALLADRFARM
jgi:glycerophosphoryl diester phosphodiesterase